MKTIAKALSILSFAAALTIPLAAAADQAPAPGSATISDPGSADRSGFTILVEPSGHTWALDGAGHSTGTLNFALTQAFFTDLASAGQLSQLSEGACANALIIGWNGQRSSNIACSPDQRAMHLMNDVVAIQRALYVQSYRTTVDSRGPAVSYAAPSGRGQGYSDRSSAWYGSVGAGTSYYATGGSYSGGLNGSHSSGQNSYGPTVGQNARFNSGGNGFTSQSTQSFANSFNQGKFQESRFQEGRFQEQGISNNSTSRFSSNAGGSLSSSSMSFGPSSFGQGGPTSSSVGSSGRY